MAAALNSTARVRLDIGTLQAAVGEGSACIHMVHRYLETV